MDLSHRQVENRVVELLIYKGWQVAFAESCTGGLAAARIVDVPNASKVLSASFVTYSPEAKPRQTSSAMSSAPLTEISDTYRCFFDIMSAFL